MKKMNTKGFTLIELLAVITIMGILLLVAIPAVSRTIENSRRDTFVDVANEYIDAVRNGILAENIECYDTPVGATTGDFRVVSAVQEGDYYYPICTSESNCNAITTDGALEAANIASNTKDLLESGGKSSFGSAELQGYVKITIGSNQMQYAVLLTDTGKHGISTETKEEELSRSKVLTKLDNTFTATNTLSGAGSCRIK